MASEWKFEWNSNEFDVKIDEFWGDQVRWQANGSL